MILKTVRNTFILILLACFIAGSGGITILVHDCSGSKKRDFTTYPEYLHKNSESCCPADHQAISTEQSHQTAVNKAACCKSSKITLKVNPYERVYTTQASVLISPELPVCGIISQDFEPDDTLVIACNSPPSPEVYKPSGKELVFSLHQLRIPSDC